MTNEQVVKHLTAKLECLTRSKGFREKCDTYNSYEGCYECDLAYKQGNIGEQIESLKLVIKALEEQSTLDKIRAEIEQNAYPIVHGVNNRENGMTLYGILQIIDKYKAESEIEDETKVD